MLSVSLSLTRLSLGQQDLGQPTLGGDSSKCSVSVSEQQESRRPVSATGSLVGLSGEQHDSAELPLTDGALAGSPSEQQDFAHLPLMGGSLAGSSLECTYATVDDFMADLTRSPEPLRRRRRFSAAWSCVTEPLLPQESREVRRRERADDFLEHCFPSSEWRSRTSQQLSWPRSMRARQ